MNKKSFGYLKNGEEAGLYVLKKDKLCVYITDYGARIVSMFVPDKEGEMVDVCLGFDSLAEYESDEQSFGAVVGRVANRICNAEFRLDGMTYKLDQNDGVNHLHGGSGAFSKKLWHAEGFAEDKLLLSLYSPDGDACYPGDMTVSVEYSLVDDCALKIAYAASTSSATICNITNHSYFNLDGHSSGTVYDQFLRIKAERFAELDSSMIPTGRLCFVAGTPMDFRTMKKIGRDIGKDFEQIRISDRYGYDNAYELISGEEPTVTALSEKTGIEMSVRTTLPSVQLYTANFLDNIHGKGGAVYNRHCAFCLEAQLFPDAVNHPEFGSCVLRKGELWENETIYSFKAV